MIHHPGLFLRLVIETVVLNYYNYSDLLLCNFKLIATNKITITIGQLGR